MTASAAGARPAFALPGARGVTGAMALYATSLSGVRRDIALRAGAWRDCRAPAAEVGGALAAASRRSDVSRRGSPVASTTLTRLHVTAAGTLTPRAARST